MSNIYLKATIESSSKLRFPGFKKFTTRSALGSSNPRKFHWILKLLVATGKSDVWGQDCVWLFYHFNLKRSYDVFKSKSLCILLKIWTLITMKRNRKLKIPHKVLEGRTLCFSLYKNCKSKVKLCWVGAPKRRKEGIFCTFYFFLNEKF